MKLASMLHSFGFHPSKADTSLFILDNGGKKKYCLAYVDDLIITSRNTTLISKLIAHLQSHFLVKDLGPLNYFLGIEVSYSKGGLLLMQHKYIVDLLHRGGTSTCKPMPTPISKPKQGTTPAKLAPFPDPSLFRSVVGGLQYLSFTRPDISLAINKLA